MLLQGLNGLSISEILWFLIDEITLKQHHVFRYFLPELYIVVTQQQFEILDFHNKIYVFKSSLCLNII